MSNPQLKKPRSSGRVSIIVNAKVKQEGRLIAASPVTERMVTALKNAIAANSPDTIIDVIAVASLWSEVAQRQTSIAGRIYCPLTIQLPKWLTFPAQTVYQSCQDVLAHRLWVEEKLNCKTNHNLNWLGDLWLPIIWTENGPLYAEVIGEGMMPNAYQQPIKLADKLYQYVQTLAYKNLEALEAPPSVYLLQFSVLSQEIIFDRLWPFPAAPAIASLGRQTPDLFACHWYCLTNQEIPPIPLSPHQNALN
ncbi:MAG: hypothetical protein VKJ02_12300 [Snowella sp.]|nr:hypothetical protein [Snowella sp.]